MRMRAQENLCKKIIRKPTTKFHAQTDVKFVFIFLKITTNISGFKNLSILLFLA